MKDATMREPGIRRQQRPGFEGQLQGDGDGGVDSTVPGAGDGDGVQSHQLPSQLVHGGGQLQGGGDAYEDPPIERPSLVDRVMLTPARLRDEL